MTSIAFSLIGHNEAHNLPRCLESIRWADEVVYVDCESSDGSAEVARRFTGRVFARPNLANLNVNKTFGIGQTTADWVFYLDPDEVIPPALGEEIRAAIASNPPQNAFSLPRRNFYLGAWLRHGGQYPDTQLRLFRQGRARFPCKHVHEKLEVDGEIGSFAEAMEHYTNPTTAEVMKKLDFYSSFNADAMLAEGKRPGPGMALRYLFWTPSSRFVRRYFLKGGFRDGWPGLTVAIFDGLENQVRFLKFCALFRQQAAATGEAVNTEAASSSKPTEPKEGQSQ
ncbi:MAG: glycosyltransferase family 2 protein [SAR324 cluster bacterium]|nr:glycosyltransferase family 2 protein [SAR324 cluster bacterium]